MLIKTSICTLNFCICEIISDIPCWEISRVSQSQRICPSVKLSSFSWSHTSTSWELGIISDQYADERRDSAYSTVRNKEDLQTIEGLWLSNNQSVLIVASSNSFAIYGTGKLMTFLAFRDPKFGWENYGGQIAKKTDVHKFLCHKFHRRVSRSFPQILSRWVRWLLDDSV